ncbi:MAG: ABC transporter permease subunit [Bdellovibrionales bacterium]|nr:ABC transporter permease subunit [Bdellovibrionales bacterium]
MILRRGLLTLLLLTSNALFAQSAGILRWGADIESGAPFAYKDPAQPDKIVGFEAEIVEALAKELGMRAQFFQNNWGGLIQGLERKDYDIVVNGIEITPDRAREVTFSRPYYITSEVLTVRKSTDDIHRLEDLENQRVGTLTASLAQRILNEQSFPMKLVTYDEEMHLYNDLAFGRIDAVLLDEPIALYYAKPNPQLKIVGGPIGLMDYGIATRKNDPEFSARIDQALQKLISDGTIRGILEKWGLWNPLCAKAWGQSADPQTPSTAYDDYLKTAFKDYGFKERVKRYVSFLPLLAKGAWMTLQISVLSMILAIVIGLITAVARLYGNRVVSFVAMAFVEVFRGTPLLIQLFLIFYGLPHLGIRFDPFMAAVIGLGLNYGACEAENYRAGILSIPKAQMDASQALGLSRRQSLRHIILPQAIRVVIPPVTNDFIALLKDSSLVSVITMVELTATYGQLASTYFDYLGIGLLTAAVYFLIGLPFVRLSRHFEKNLNAHNARPTQSVSGK